MTAGVNGIGNYLSTPFARSNGLAFNSVDNQTPGYIPTQFKTQVNENEQQSLNMRNANSFRHQNRHLVSANQQNASINSSNNGQIAN